MACGISKSLSCRPWDAASSLRPNGCVPYEGILSGSSRLVFFLTVSWRLFHTWRTASLIEAAFLVFDRSIWFLQLSLHASVASPPCTAGFQQAIDRAALGDTPLAFSGRDLSRAKSKADVFGDAHVRPKCKILKHHCNAAELGRALAVRFVTLRFGGRDIGRWQRLGRMSLGSLDLVVSGFFVSPA